jgi:hypothetical protein
MKYIIIIVISMLIGAALSRLPDIIIFIKKVIEKIRCK